MDLLPNIKQKSPCKLLILIAEKTLIYACLEVDISNKREKKTFSSNILSYLLLYHTLGRQGVLLTSVAVGNDRRANVVTVPAIDPAV